MNVISLQTRHGRFKVSQLEHDGQQAILIKTESLSENPFVRIHSSCVFSEALHADDCDCALQLNASLDYIEKHSGVVIYLFQEGRGAGLDLKIKAIELEQRDNIDTAEAYGQLGLHQDPRTYPAAIKILKDLNLKKITIGTNNPEKIRALEEAGIEIYKLIDLEIPETQKIKDYRDRKTAALKHFKR
ncbi:TPA: GTP cyclohydrolase II RibA [Pseudomonas putida]|nr:GTP cyclohydrolase II RibA [Pseudomonas putida]